MSEKTNGNETQRKGEGQSAVDDDHGLEQVPELVVASAKERSERKKAEQASVSVIAAWSPRKKSLALLALFAVIAFFYALVGIYACAVAPVVVCGILLMQVVIGALLDQNPVWLHGCVVAADVIAGFCVSHVLLMVLAAVVYVMAIVTIGGLQRLGMAAKTK